MAMYYYASKLNEASCSGCKVPPAPAEPAPAPPAPPPPLRHSAAPSAAAPTAAALPPPLPPPLADMHANGLSYYDNDDYYSMVRGNKFMSEASCKHIVMNGSINFLAAQKMDQPQSCGGGAKSRGGEAGSVCGGGGGGAGVEYNKEGRVSSAPLEALVDMLRPGAPRSFVFTFILCSRLFLKPHELLTKLCKRYFKNYDKIGKGDVKEVCEREVSDMSCLVRVLDAWTAMFPYDFRDDRVMALVRTITQRCAAEHMCGVRAQVSGMLERLLDKLTALEQYEETLLEVPPVSSVEQLPAGDVLSLGVTPAELAAQLTLLELHRLAFVGPEELVQAFAPPPSAHAPLDNKTTRNLEAYADWFNRLSYLVATDVLKNAKSKYRARVLEHWVMTARECFNLANFNSLMAIISALNMAPVTRLKKTWSRTSGVCGQQLRQLELCVEPSSNHARYRAALAAAPAESAVPLLSVTCRDLHFANQAAPTKVGGNRINFDKCCVLARHVSGQLASRRLTADDTPPPAPCPPHTLPARLMPVWRYLNDRPTLTDNALELLSFEREPPADHLEKERLKRLRGAT